MMRLLIAVMISTLALAGAALADDDYYDYEDQVIPRDSAPAKAEKAEADESTPGHEFHPGTYFGDGDPRQSGAFPVPEARYADGIGISTSSRAAYALGAGNRHESINTDQVYGPMWGVPEDAVGMDGYQQYYDLMMLGNPEMLPEGYHLPNEHNHTGDETANTASSAGKTEEPVRKQGLKLAGDDDW